MTTTKPTLQDLPPGQRKAYRTIRKLILKRGFPPTIREIGEALGIQSPNGVMCHLKALERKGLIERDAKLSRAIVLCERED